ncbi:178_t:CDS:2 [Ambispora gerdemannii]|uniref:MICOS complex subunit n=1 Tax=Ambispora gerdemannii TaxID=144530 RepID=A0A9N9BLH0_9GLOM|nr:178_t:CDS:2 [Ambispora gerdemannii]
MNFSHSFGLLSKKKLNIYDDPRPEIVVVETPTKIEETIRQTRFKAKKALEDTENQFRQVSDRWISIEQKTERAINDVVSPKERLIPEVLYVGVAGLAGSVLAKNRGAFLRLTTPIVFTIAASYYFLPITSRNIARKLFEYEQQSPALVNIHKSISQTTEESKNKIDEAMSDIRHTLNDQVKKVEAEVKKIWK